MTASGRLQLSKNPVSIVGRWVGKPAAQSLGPVGSVAYRYLRRSDAPSNDEEDQLMTSDVPANGFMRLSAILRIIPIGKSTWWANVKSGRFPRAVKLGPRTTAWRCEDIRELILQFSSGETERGEGFK